MTETPPAEDEHARPGLYSAAFTFCFVKIKPRLSHKRVLAANGGIEFAKSSTMMRWPSGKGCAMATVAVGAASVLAAACDTVGPRGRSTQMSPHKDIPRHALRPQWRAANSRRLAPVAWSRLCKMARDQPDCEIEEVALV